MSKIITALKATGAIFAMSVVVTVTQMYVGNAFWFMEALVK
jgi:hypothetical protein